MIVYTNLQNVLGIFGQSSVVQRAYFENLRESLGCLRKSSECSERSLAAVISSLLLRSSSDYCCHANLYMSRGSRTFVLHVHENQDENCNHFLPTDTDNFLFKSVLIGLHSQSSRSSLVYVGNPKLVII